MEEVKMVELPYCCDSHEEYLHAYTWCDSDSDSDRDSDDDERLALRLDYFMGINFDSVDELDA